MDFKFKLVDYEDDLFAGRVAVATDGVLPDELLEGEFLKLKIKMPLQIYSTKMAFYNYCQFDMGDIEGFLLIMLRNGEYRLGCPDQTNSGVGVDAHPEKNPGEFPDVIGDSHCHQGMRWSGHSGVDDADEAKHRHGIFMVLSSDETGFSIFSTSITIYGYAKGRKFYLKPEDVFDMSSRRGEMTFPDEWKKRIRARTNWMETLDKEDRKFVEEKEYKKRSRGFWRLGKKEFSIFGREEI